MTLITESWRLKLLALALAVVMLGAVAFSQSNTRTIQVNMTYNNLPPNLALVGQIDRISVTVLVPNDFVLNPSSVTASADLTHVKKGSAISVPIHVTPTDLRIAVQAPPPITVNVDNIASLPLDIQVRTPFTAVGWAVTKAVAECGNTIDACKVTFTGPLALAAGLTAFVTVSDRIQAGTTDSLNQTVQFEQNGRPVDLTKLQTLPQITINPSTVTAHVEAKRGTSSTQLTLVDDAPTRRPPTGYRVTDITVAPLSVLCTGPADAIANLTSITLPAVDLGSSTSTVSFNVRIPFPAGVTCGVATARITYVISQNPNVNPTPTPS
ncbi:MAG TPA: CdaR family protein [Candidatus Dormibacteraeota bacterium]|nr:CdaR family protein [Candidatus Dormibacteraeota bacterium]